MKQCKLVHLADHWFYERSFFLSIKIITEIIEGINRFVIISFNFRVPFNFIDVVNATSDQYL